MDLKERKEKVFDMLAQIEADASYLLMTLPVLTAALSQVNTVEEGKKWDETLEDALNSLEIITFKE